MPILTFKITPIGKPRMVRSDTWAERPVVMQYWAYKDKLNYLANLKRFKVGTMLDVVFVIPVPESWSRKKKLMMIGKPHGQKPDVDNLLKAFMDCLLTDDSGVWDVHVRKIWGLEGSIQVFQDLASKTRHCNDVRRRRK